MNQVVTTTMTLNELKQVIRESIFDYNKADETSHPSEEKEAVLNQKEAAKFLGITQATLINWKKRGKVPYEQLDGSSKVRFYKSQLKAAVQQNPHLLRASRN